MYQMIHGFVAILKETIERSEREHGTNAVFRRDVDAAMTALLKLLPYF